MIDQHKIRQRLSTPHWGAKGTNASLWLDKYIAEQSSDDPKSRWDLVRQVATLPEPAEYKDYFAHWEKTLKKDYGEQTTRRVKVKGRMIVGLGSESVLETSICLHRTYGVPYIPGSALKGLAVSYAHQRLGGEWQRGHQFHTIVFGDTDKAGYITFFDALYLPGSGYPDSLGKPRALYPDVITVHHQNYYQNEGVAPSDSDNTNPVPFLSATGIYLFALAAPDFQNQTRWIDLTFQILAEALDKFGIGAKTSSGYGRMEFLDNPARQIHPEVRTAERYKGEIEGMREQDVAGRIPDNHRK
jgi:CRISPR-associated protein Cmr6